MSEGSEKRFQLRISEELYNELEEWSNEELRSVNAQMIKILREAIAARKAGRESKSREGIRTPDLILAV